MEDTRGDADRDTVGTATDETGFQEAERAYLAALDQAGIKSNPEQLSRTLHDLIDLYERHAEYIVAEQNALRHRQMRDDERQAVDPEDFHRLQRQRWERDDDAWREHARAVADLGRKQLACYKRLLDCQERSLGERHPDLVAILLAMAGIQGTHFNEFGAFPLLQRALAIRESALGADHTDTLAIVRQLASGYSSMCGFGAAAPLWRRLLIHAERDFAAAPAGNALPLREVLGWLAESYVALRDSGAAEQTWRRILALSPPAAGSMVPPARWPDFPDREQLDSLYGIGRACMAQGKWREAELALREALALHERYPEYVLSVQQGIWLLGRDAGLHDYAATLRELGRPEEALPLFARALALNRQRGWRFALLLRDYAATLRDVGQGDEAELLERRAREVEAMIPVRRGSGRRATS